MLVQMGEMIGRMIYQGHVCGLRVSRRWRRDDIIVSVLQIYNTSLLDQYLQSQLLCLLTHSPLCLTTCFGPTDHHQVITNKHSVHISKKTSSPNGSVVFSCDCRYCLIDLCYIFVIHTQQDATQRNKIVSVYRR
jgi:hypothetical protein